VIGLVEWPGGVNGTGGVPAKAGGREERRFPISTLDVLPTLLDLLGTTVRQEELSVNPIIIYPLYTVIHLHFHIYTYVHPLYMYQVYTLYIHHIYTQHTSKQPINTLYTPYIHPKYTTTW